MDIVDEYARRAEQKDMAGQVMSPLAEKLFNCFAPSDINKQLENIINLPKGQ